MHNEGFIKGYLLPGLPHIYLAPEKNKGWKKLNQAFQRVREEIENSGADLILIYSTYWPSILGHQIQALPEIRWTHVDDQFHDLGSIPYVMKIDAQFAENYRGACLEKNLHARTTAYEGFPVDTGSVVFSQLVNPENKIPMCIVSSNIYSDRAETILLAKAAVEAVKKGHRKVIAVAISSLSNRLFTTEVDPKDDKIHSLKDQEWNEKFLDILREGRLEDAAQLSRNFHREARVPKVVNFKPFWWLSTVMGNNNNYEGDVFEYQPVMGTGAAVVSVTPCEEKSNDLEYDEDTPETFMGDRQVLGGEFEGESSLIEMSSEELGRNS